MAPFPGLKILHYPTDSKEMTTAEKPLLGGIFFPDIPGETGRLRQHIPSAPLPLVSWRAADGGKRGRAQSGNMLSPDTL